MEKKNVNANKTELFNQVVSLIKQAASVLEKRAKLERSGLDCSEFERIEIEVFRALENAETEFFHACEEQMEASVVVDVIQESLDF